MNIFKKEWQSVQNIYDREKKEWNNTAGELGKAVKKQKFREKLREGFEQELSPVAEEKQRKLLRILESFMLILFPASLVFFLSGFFWFASVSGNSMAPTYESGEFVIVDKRDQTMNYGDVILLEDKDGIVLIKRIIGLPGDKIEAFNGKVVLNGKTLDESYTASETEDFGPVTVADDSYFVLGDNRSDSIDSRNFGSVSVEQIIGIVKR